MVFSFMNNGDTSAALVDEVTIMNLSSQFPRRRVDTERGENLLLVT